MFRTICSALVAPAAIAGFAFVTAFGTSSANAQFAAAGTAATATEYATGLSGVPQMPPGIVLPADTFSISVTGQTTTPAAAFLLTNQLTSTFGTTQTFTNAALGGQTVTVTSSETTNGTQTTDTFTISVPTDFIPTGTLASNGAPFTSIFVNIGNANAGGNVVNFALPIQYPAGYSDFFTINPNLSTTQFTFTETVGGGNTTFLGSGGIANGGANLAGLGVREFTVSITYSEVPEPASLALLGVAALPMLRRRRKA